MLYERYFDASYHSHIRISGQRVFIMVLKVHLGIFSSLASVGDKMSQIAPNFMMFRFQSLYSHECCPIIF